MSMNDNAKMTEAVSEKRPNGGAASSSGPFPKRTKSVANRRKFYASLRKEEADLQNRKADLQAPEAKKSSKNVDELLEECQKELLDRTLALSEAEAKLKKRDDRIAALELSHVGLVQFNTELRMDLDLERGQNAALKTKLQTLESDRASLIISMASDSAADDQNMS